MAVEAVIRGRPPEEGGPYQVFRCDGCGAENGVLAGPCGGLLLHPLMGLESPSLLDRLLSAREQALLDGARAWWLRHREAVRRFREGPPAASGSDGAATAAPHGGPDRAERRPALTGPQAVLGVPADASLREIRLAFLRLAKRWHPDRAGPAGAAQFRAVRAAYDELRRSRR